MHPDLPYGDLFPAMVLLKREEIETLKVSGDSVIAALHHGHGHKGRMYQEAPFDLSLIHISEPTRPY